MAAKNKKRGLENRQVTYLPLWQSTSEAGQARVPWTRKGLQYLIKAFTSTFIYQASLKGVNGSKRSINQFTHPKHMPPWKKGKTQSRFQDCTLCASMPKHSGGLQFKNDTKSLSRTSRSPQQNDFLVQCEYDRQETKITSAACTIEQNGSLFFGLYPDTRDCFYFTSKVLK